MKWFKNIFKKSESVVSAERVSRRLMAAYSPLDQLTPTYLSSVLSMFKAGELRTFDMLWQDARDRDDIIGTVEGKRRKAVSRLNWEITQQEDTPAAARQKEICEHFFSNLTYTDVMDQDIAGGMRGLISGMMHSLATGHSVQEIIWQPSSDGLTAEFRQLPLSFFERRSGRLRYLPAEGAYTGVEMPPSEWLVTASGERLGIASLVLYLYKHMPLRDWLIYCQRYVVPGLHGKTPAKKDTSEWNDLRDGLGYFNQDFAIITGTDATIEPLDVSAKGELPYPPLIARCDQRITAIWRGADLSTISAADATGASLQEGETNILTDDDKTLIGETIDTRLIPHILMFTLGSNQKQLVNFELNSSSPHIDRDIKVDTFLINAGVPVGVVDLLSRYGRRMPDEGDEVARQLPSNAEGAAPLLNSANLAATPAHRRNPLLATLAADLYPLRSRIAAALQLPDAAMLSALAEIADDAPALYRAMADGGMFANALELTLAEAFVEGVETAGEDHEA